MEQREMGVLKPKVDQQVDNSSKDSKDRELLSAGEAYQEFLMMRKALNLDRDGMFSKLNDSTGEWEKIKPTKEDLDDAYEKVSELVRLAEEESDAKKFLCAFGRILNGATMVSAKIVTQVFASCTYLLFPLGDEDRTKPVWDDIDDTYRDIKRRLVDAQKTLDDYRKNAEKYFSQQNLQ